MHFKTILAALAFACSATSATYGASAASSDQLFMKTGERAPQPVGHYRFCEVHPSECRPTTSDRKTPFLTEVGWHAIEEVNASVNRRIIQVTDEAYYGKLELWTYPKSAGDCEDFALLKKRELKARGFKESDLLMTVVKKPDGSGHAILTVHTSEGDFVLDNLDDRVRLWRQTPYRFEKRQSSTDAGQWVVIEHPAADAPVAAIN